MGNRGRPRRRYIHTYGSCLVDDLGVSPSLELPHALIPVSRPTVLDDEALSPGAVMLPETDLKSHVITVSVILVKSLSDLQSVFLLIAYEFGNVVEVGLFGSSGQRYARVSLM